MKLKLTLQREDGQAPVDVLCTVDALATVGDVARVLHVSDPLRRQVQRDVAWTLEQVDGAAVRMSAATSVVDSPIVSGAMVRLVPAGSAGPSPRRATAATVRVLVGPDAGKEFALGRGTSRIGRAEDCEVRLSDTSVSRQHAKLQIGEVAEVIDLGSSNGVVVDGGVVARAAVTSHQRIALGDTTLVVETATTTDEPASAASGGVPFNRSPRLDPTHAGATLVVPDPPQRQQKQRLPLITVLAPLLFGAVLYAVTRNPTSLIFVALSPVMAVGSVLEARFAGGRAHAAALAGWRSELVALREEAATALSAELASRLVEHPSTADALDAVSARSALLWTRRPADERFLHLRLGRGVAPARLAVELPGSRQAEKAVWQEAEQVRAEAALLAGAPLPADLTRGPVGVAGRGEAGLAAARALVVQLVALHSPAEVVLAGCLAADAAARWDWLKWLPHTTSAHSPLSGPHLTSGPAAAQALLAELEGLLAERGDDRAVRSPRVVLLVEDATPAERARLVNLAERGSPAGIHVLWVAPSRDRLPAACTDFLDLGALASAVVGDVTTGTALTDVTAESLDLASAAAAARALAPLVDSGAPLDDTSDLPRSVSWLSLHDRALAQDPERVIERWSESRSLMTGPRAHPPARGKPGSLRAVIGQTAGEPHVLDLRVHGPHALVGGTTGSGKSEMLQSWILGLAAAHSPQRVTFLLVDYKGGSAFRECLDLPHTVGLVTDLSPALVRRALTSLAAELTFREELLASKRKKDLAELEREGDPDTPPSLVIVVDEFAALVQEVPEFVDGVVNVAQRGRSLGLHLVLATQRPAGVIRGNLRANTNLRLALRVADADDSADVIGTPQAAAFDPTVPGRGLSKTGPGRLVGFQAAYAGGWTTDEPEVPRVDVEELALGAPREWEEPDAEDESAPADLGPNDISRVVSTISEASRLAGLPVPRKPWLPELADVYELGTQPTARRDDRLVFGVRDLPHQQAQPALSFFPDRDGNLAVYGTGGSGKSGVLRALAVASAFTYRGGACQVYGLDFGARGLSMLEPLPHVGSIVPGSDHERLTRLLGLLRSTIDERAARYAAVRAGTIVEYRQLAGRPEEPRLLLLVDGLGAFRSAYEATDRVKWFEMLQGIAADGRPVGVHVVLSADRAGAVPTALAASVQSRIVLRAADENEYVLLGEPTDVLSAQSPPGRAVVDGDAAQVAVLGGSQGTLQQARAIVRLAETMRAAGIPTAPPIEALPERVGLDELSAAEGPVLGVSGVDLGVATLPTEGTFLITGPGGSGRTSALQTAVAALARWDPRVRLHYVGERRSPLVADPSFSSAVTDPVLVPDLVRRLTDEISLGGPSSRHVLVLESVADLIGTPADLPLQGLVKQMVKEGHLVLAEADIADVKGMGMLLSALKAGRSGLALQAEQYDGTVFGTEFPRYKRHDLPPGRGVLVRRGRTELVHVALPSTGTRPPSTRTA